MNLSNLHPAEGSKHSDNFRRGRGHAPETERQLVRDTKARRLVPEHRDPVLKAVRCLYTDVFRREALRISILRRS